MVSNAATYSLQEVADGTTESHWFQLYPWGNNRRHMLEMLRRADPAWGQKRRDAHASAELALPQPVTDVLEILRSELHRTLVLMGCRDVRDLDRSWLIPVDPLMRTTSQSPS